MHRPLLSLLLAFAAYSMLNISQAGQKIGLGLYPTRRLVGSLIWLAATLGTSAAAFVNLFALSLGSVSLVGAMAGSGLASLALFSWLVMKEPIDTRELIGVGIIFAAAFLMGAFARPPRMEALRLPILFVILAVSVLTFSLLWVALRRRDFAAAVVIAAFSGTLGGLVALFQKVSTSPLARSLSLARGAEPAGRGLSGVAQTLSNPYSLAWILLSVLSMVVIQFAYRRGRAIRIIPAFSASYIVVPVVGGMLVFAETLRPMQWLGIAAIVAGILLLTLKQPPAAAGDAGGESRTRPGAGPP